mmetsp:Transcript_18118/g.58547  ORF Transcript_18118/g.58547 Transcript_18118/m.58547 type:complete len:115 (+) Transcript_18118:164-508(+)|eukprot:CAMPEP_0118890614 /NCGR_PEP_ID=MMETSP1166-20130328/995_1 /TAXON_ID=1104430 /ORGANISM="Chrysoreinhardia sp, Strain CCMP3193" /LENGTH=114 /DNA_ID=CAMNT_0006829233 /DNA_START=316 /DNA_END=660 /DNA_ORIENTATION=+
MRRRQQQDDEADDGMKQWGPSDILSAEENRPVVIKLARHMVAVAIGPVGTYILVRDLIPKANRHRDTIAAIAAVLVLNLLIALYVVVAFTEKTDGEPQPQVVKRLGRWAEPRTD